MMSDKQPAFHTARGAGELWGAGGMKEKKGVVRGGGRRHGLRAEPLRGEDLGQGVGGGMVKDFHNLVLSGLGVGEYGI